VSTSTLEDLVGTRWRGKGELWPDPLGNETQHYDCTLEIADGAVRYSWTHEGKAQQGHFALDADGASWSDSWHQSEALRCERQTDDWGLLSLRTTYGAGEGPDWGWHTSFALRPTGQLVMQMTNVTPWGEHGRAVRMVFERE